MVGELPQGPIAKRCVHEQGVYLQNARTQLSPLHAKSHQKHPHSQ